MSSFVRVTSPAPLDEWKEILAQDPHATAMQTPDWFHLVRDVVGGSDASCLYELADGRRLILPLIRRGRTSRFAIQAAYPHGYGLGGLLASGGLRSTDVQDVLDDLRRSRALSTRITANHDVAYTWQAGKIPGVVDFRSRAEVLDLNGGMEVVWSRRYKSSTRVAIRRAQNVGVTIKLDTSGRLVSEFYDLYHKWTARRAQERRLPGSVAAYLARRREPFAKFRAATALPGRICRTWMAYVDGRAAASIITIVYGRYAFYWRGYSDKELAGPARANNLLHHMAIDDAWGSGCRYYDMGQSGGIESLERFKQSFGATAQPLVDFRIERFPFSKGEIAFDEAQRRVLTCLSRLSSGT
jgi:CelD/BcsL family acetyltransferase involved in cellulose biosynthesis